MTAKHAYKTFEHWWRDLVHVAAQAGIALNLDEPETYREYYDDGDTPSQTLRAEARA